MDDAEKIGDAMTVCEAVIVLSRSTEAIQAAMDIKHALEGMGLPDYALRYIEGKEPK